MGYTTTNSVFRNYIKTFLGKKYDFIIIGGGTAGSVLASRLSETTEWKILLLEAGQQPPILSAIPSMAQNLQLSTYNWGYLSQPENDIFKGLNGNKMLWSSGKVLGGSSSINYMIYERGNPEDYDTWEKLGNKGWSFKDVLPYFLKSEKSNLKSNSDTEFHGKSGPMIIDHSYSGESALTFIEAGKKMGFNITDYNGRNQIGFSYLQGTLKKGGRQTTANAFLEPSLNRSNLEVVLLAEAIKIQINTSKKKATAVQFIKGNKTYKSVASKEIILSAGAFNSPKLLMLSGIGPGKILKELNIRPKIKNLPVGQSLGDHVTYPGLNFITNQSENQLGIIKDYILGLPSWYISGKGRFSSLRNFEAVGFLNVDNSSSSRPNVELLFLNSDITSVDKNVMNIKSEIFEKLYNNTKENITWSIYPTLLHPQSKGKIHLNSKQVQEAPLLYPNYFTNPNDIKTMIRAIRFVLQMLKTPAFTKLKAILNPNAVPGCESLKNGSDDYWECAIRTLATTGYDQFGSCKMGTTNNKEAVVDNELKVYGVESLRVVDASVIPSTISGRLMATTIMIAEKAADLIKDSYKI